MTLVPFPDFVWLWAREQGQSMPLLHDRMARWLAECWESGDRQLLLMAFRGSGKSTLVGLFAAWLLCRDPNLRLLVLAADLAFLPSVSLEINGLGRFLPGLLRQELKRQGVTCAVIEVSSRQPKHQRIVEAFDVVLAAGALNAHRGVWDTPFVREMRDWRPDARFKGRDDGLDAVAGCLKAEPVRLSGPARPGWGAGANAIVSDAKWYP